MLGSLSRDRAAGPQFDGRFAVRAAAFVLALALAVQAFRLTLIFLEPVRPESPGRETGAAAATRPVALGGFDPFFRNGGVGDAPGGRAGDPAAEDALVLYGVRGGGGRGAAILSGPDGVQRSYAVGEEVRPGVVLRSVAFDHVVLARGAGESRLGFPAVSTAAAPSAVAALVSPTASTPSPPPATEGAAAAFQREAALRPNLVGRRVRGYVLSLRDSNGALGRAGLRTGDVILSVNGTVLEPDSLASLPAELAVRPEVVVAYERDGASASATVRPVS